MRTRIHPPIPPAKAEGKAKGTAKAEGEQMRCAQAGGIRIGSPSASVRLRRDLASRTGGIREVAFLLSVFCFLLSASSFAAELVGTVKNYADGTPLKNARVQITALKAESFTDEHGVFRLIRLPVGIHVVTAYHSGYHAYTVEQSVTDVDQTYRLDVELKPSVEGETTSEYQETQPRYNMPEVTVLTTRASANDPVTYSNLSQSEIQQRTYGQDLPLLFTELPNVVAYSDGANGVGYSYLRMRGFPQSRVAVEVNGTPLNDAGDGEVFWIDLPDFAQDLQDVQVQRGVGSSLYGPAAFGGTINVVTRTPGLLDHPTLRAEGTYGSFDTRRAMVMVESGRIQDKYGISARLTRMSTDGYRDQSWANLWSYYLSAARFGKAHTTRVVFYGGPERTHLAYDGATPAELAANRRYNPLIYPGETDNFFQPHYEIHDEWKLSSKLNFNNSLYLFRGDGYYDQWRPQQKFSKYFFSPSQQMVHEPDTTSLPIAYYARDDSGRLVQDTLAGGSIQYRVTQFDALRRRNIGETDWGWIPRFRLDHHFGETTIGGELRLQQAHHEGWILWGNPLPVGIVPDQRYYDYRIRKASYSAYVSNLISLTSSLRAMADLQFQTRRYRMDRDRLFGVTFEKTYTSLNPRLGLNYQFLTPDGKSRTPAASVYANLSWAQREPAYKDIYDPQNNDLLPINDPVDFRTVSSGYVYAGPALKPEKMQNLEVGTNWQWLRGRLGVNYYHMSVRDELVAYGFLNDLGVPLAANADRTLHQGVEFIGSYGPWDWLTLSGNLALTDHHFVHYKEIDWVSYSVVSRDGNRLANDPPYVANIRAETRFGGVFGAVSVQAIGKQFIDNTENSSTAVSAYNLVNLDLGYRFTRLGTAAHAVELRVRLNNLLNRKYETFGFLNDNGDPVYIVGAPRAAYSTLAVDF